MTSRRASTRSSASSCAPAMPSRGSSGSGSRAHTRRTSVHLWSRPSPSAARSASTSTCRSSRAPRGSSRRCAARTPASGTWRSSTGCATQCRTSPSAPTSSSASPARPRRTSPRRSRSSRRSGFDSAFTFVYSPRAGTEAADYGRAGPRGRQARSDGAARRRRAARRLRAEHLAGRAGRGGPRRGAEPHRLRRSSAAERVGTRRSTSRGCRSPATSSRSRSRRRRPPRCGGASARRLRPDAGACGTIGTRSARSRHPCVADRR